MLAFSLATGIVVGRASSITAILFMAGLFLYTSYPLDRRLRGFMGLAFIAGAGLIVAHDRSTTSLPTGYEKATSASFTVEATDTVLDDAIRYRVTLTRLDGEPVPATLLRLSLRRRPFPSRYLPGDRLTMTTPRFIEPRGSRNVGLFDYEAWLDERGIAGLLYARRSSTVTNDGAGWRWRRPLDELKNVLRSRLTFDDPRITAVAWATLLGDTGRIDHATRDQFARSGLAHLLAVSGLHVGFVAGAIYSATRLFIFFPAWRWRRRWAESGALITFAAGVALVGAVGYGLMTGPRFPAERATIMVGVYLGALMTGRGRQFVGAFSLAAIITLLDAPWGLFDAGFLLSYGAVLFIALFMERYVNGFITREPDPMERVDPPLAWVVRRVPTAAGIVGVTLAAGIATAPIAAYAFHQLPYWSFPLNMLVSPMAGVAIPLGMGAGLTGWPPLLGATDRLMTLLATVADRFGGSDDAMPIPLPPAAAPMATWLLLLALVGGLRPPRPRLTLPALAMATVLLWLWPIIALRFEKEMTVRFVDVGQGLSVAAFWPEGGGLVIDGGGWFPRFDTGRGVLAPLVLSTGRTSLSLIGATHGDIDHAGGLAGLATVIPATTMTDNGLPDSGRSLATFRALARERGVYRTLAAGDRIAFDGGMTMEILSPPTPLPDDFPTDDNNRSLVVRLVYGETSVLIVGDLSKKGEEWLVDHGVDLHTDVLSVGHHGSNSSSSTRFLNAVGAKTAVINVGDKNRWRFPAKAVTERIERHGIALYRTDLAGEVIMTSDGKSIRWTNWKEKEGNDNSSTPPPITYHNCSHLPSKCVNSLAINTYHVTKDPLFQRLLVMSIVWYRYCNSNLTGSGGRGDCLLALPIITGLFHIITANYCKRQGSRE